MLAAVIGTVIITTINRVESGVGVSRSNFSYVRDEEIDPRAQRFLTLVSCSWFLTEPAVQLLELFSQTHLPGG